MRHSIRLIALGLVAFMLVGLATALAAEPPRIALVVGNSKYDYVPSLPNPANDARLIGNVLQGLGFQLIGGRAQIDVDNAQLLKLIQDFGNRIGPGVVAVFYYAGHGIQVHGQNYLVPTGANLRRPQDIALNLVRLDTVVDQMNGSSVAVVILDACRNNPFAERGFNDGTMGLAQMGAPRGTVIAFATQPGAVALDGTGHDRDSPFAKALSEEMPKPNESLLDMFNNVSAVVNASTNQGQLPWVSSSAIDQTFNLGGDLGRPRPSKQYASNNAGPGPSEAGVGKPGKAPLIMSPPPGMLKLPGAPTPPEPERKVPDQDAASPAPADPTQTELVLWQNVRFSSDPADFQAYLNRYPNGTFSDLAKHKIELLKGTVVAANSAVPKPAATKIDCKVEPLRSSGYSEQRTKLTVSASGAPCPIVNKGSGFVNYSLRDEPKHGSVAIEIIDSGFGAKVVYTPDSDFTGEDSFDYRLMPGNTLRQVMVTVGP